MIYANCYSNLHGEDRVRAIAAMQDDEEFDRWMEDFERRQAEMSKPTPKGGKVAVSKDDYFSMPGTVFKGSKNKES